MAKNNIRSFRYSDDVGGILEAFAGDSLNEKFENLVLHCFWERKELDRKITQRRTELAQLQEKIDAKRKELYDLDALHRDRRAIKEGFFQLSNIMLTYADKLKEDSVTQNDAQESAPLEVNCVTST